FNIARPSNNRVSGRFESPYILNPALVILKRSTIEYSAMLHALTERMIKHPFCSSRSLLAVCLFAAALFTSAACKSGYPVSARNAAATEPRAVKTALVAELPMEQAVTVTGTLAAEDQAALSAKVPGRVKTIAVDLGSVVR